MTVTSPTGVHRLLLVAPSLSQAGGVADYCRMLLQHLDPSFRASQLVVGSPANGEGIMRTFAALKRSLRSLGPALKKGRFDILHLNPSFKVKSLLRDGLLLFRIIVAGAGGRTVVLFHGWDPRLYSRIEENRLLRLIFAGLFKRAALVFVLFREAREKLIALGLAPQKVLVTTTMFEGSTAAPARGEPADPGKTAEIGILFLSRLVREKGTLIAAEVVRRLALGASRPVHAVFAGDGPDRAALQAFLEDHGLAARVETPGFVTGEAKRRLLESSDILLFPTYYGEGCPVVVLEAMGAGLAIVSTPVGAIPDIVEDGENGFIIDSRDPEDFLSAAETLLNDQALLRRIQRTNIRKARERFEASVVTRNIEAHYLSIIHAR